MRFQMRPQRQSIVMHGRHESPLALDRLDGRGARPRHLDVQLVPEPLLPVPQQFHPALHRAVGEHARVHHVLHGDYAIAPFGPETSHGNVILNGADVDRDQVQFETGILHLADFGHAFVEFGLSSLEGGMDALAGAGLLTLVAAAAGFALGGSDASSDAAFFLDGAGVVGEVGEGEEGYGFAEGLLLLLHRCFRSMGGEWRFLLVLLMEG
mmetsp:Transcript_26194/g.54715  ORF Transcript_26194/g.54715 Transcript_26194/m.54715 type:complete len:210 (+) Transcript_26194:502-1131(+)